LTTGQTRRIWQSTVRDLPAISGDGRYVVFSAASSITYKAVLYRYDASDNTVTLVSSTATGGVANGTHSSPAISADGRYTLSVRVSWGQRLIASPSDGASSGSRSVEYCC
jgi:Tol biopolymer transport system component